MRAAWFFLLLALGVCVDAQEDAAAAAGDDAFDADNFDEEHQGAAEPAEGADDDSLGADDEDEYVDKFAITSSKYVRVQVIFPEHGGISALDSLLNLRIGEVTPVLVGFANDGDESLNITSVGMYLHSAYDHSYFIQNFTKREYGREVRPHEEITLEYAFACDPNYEPMIYQISGAIEYRSIVSEDEYDFRDYSTEFVNVTIDYLPAPSRLSSTMVLGYGIFFLVLAGVSYRYLDLGSLQLFESQSGSGPSIHKKKSAQKENPELDGLTDDERRERVVNSFLASTDTNSNNSSDKKKKNLKKTKKKKK